MRKAFMSSQSPGFCRIPTCVVCDSGDTAIAGSGMAKIAAVYSLTELRLGVRSWRHGMHGTMLTKRLASMLGGERGREVTQFRPITSAPMAKIELGISLPDDLFHSLSVLRLVAARRISFSMAGRRISGTRRIYERMTTLGAGVQGCSGSGT